MFTISLHKVQIIAPIGMYSQERILSNQFEVDIDVRLPTQQDTTNEFVDYTLLNQIIRSAFTADKSSLEELAKEICTDTKKTFPFSHSIKVNIRKMNPPLSGSLAYAQVTYEV
jgi:7,8-dihydroneopterin aldolase/epimerase/oxygenase